MPDEGFFYMPSLSARTIVYKGLLLAPQIANFYTELSDPEVISALCLVHQRFSTNTFPTWQLAHPFRYIAHNGEINTLRGNVNWMHARQSVLESPSCSATISRSCFPIIQPGGSDSAAFDNALELLVMSGRSLPHAMAMLIPEAWDGNPHMDARRSARSTNTTLADGAVGRPGGDRVHRRPRRSAPRSTATACARRAIWSPKTAWWCMASETGVLPVKPEDVEMKGRLQPGKMLLVDLEQGRIVSDKEIKEQLAGRKPYGEWLAENQITLDKLGEPARVYGSDQTTHRAPASAPSVIPTKTCVF